MDSQDTHLSLKINGTPRRIDADSTTPLLWVLRDHLGLTGTKFGCGMALCGACTVHIDGAAVRSCQMPSGVIANADVVTIEGLSSKEGRLLKQLWVEMNVAQCGYCQSGMLMAAAALLRQLPKPTDEDIDTHISNICRCGTYPRVRAAIHRAAEQLSSQSHGPG